MVMAMIYSIVICYWLRTIGEIKGLNERNFQSMDLLPLKGVITAQQNNLELDWNNIEFTYRLAAGAYGTVYRAMYDGKVVAAKVCHHPHMCTTLTSYPHSPLMHSLTHKFTQTLTIVSRFTQWPYQRQRFWKNSNASFRYWLQWNPITW